ncbi:MAG: DUF1631 domain-containing protein [Sedimenticola sp.]
MNNPPTQTSVGQSKTNSQRLVKECRDMALVYLSTQLTELFEHLEPAMLDFAEKAETNQSQIRFVEAITMVKAHREDAEHRFREEINRGFAEFLQGRPITYPGDAPEYEEDSQLNIVGFDDMEYRTAIQNIITKANNRWTEDIYALRQRFAMLGGGKKLEEHDVPGCPSHLASSFQIASDAFGLEMDKVLILYALFDKFVLSETGSLFHDINAKLIDAGIFPNLKVEIEKNPYAPRPEKKKEPARAEATGGLGAEGTGGVSSSHALGEELFDSIRHMLTARRAQDPRYRDHPEFNPGAAPVQMVQPPQLASAISEIQPPAAAPYLPQPDSTGELPQTVELDESLIQEVRETLIAEREKLLDKVDRNKVPTADLDTIEMVGMLFEQVLNEELLPNIGKALISHLHTPMLKVAVIDHKFMIDNEHIARQLLNRMVAGGCQWIDEEDLRKGIYYPMQDQVRRILAEFKEDNLEIFEQVFEYIDKRINDLEQKARMVETRTQEAARGRERLEGARARANNAIEQKLGDREIPHEVDRFLNHAWLDKLILMLLRDPEVEKSREWADSMLVIDKVIWCFDACSDPERHDQLPLAINELKQLVDAGLSTLGEYHQPDRDELFSLLQSYAEKTAEEAAPIIQADSKPSAAKKASARKKQKPLSDKEKEILEDLKVLEFGTWFDLDDTSGNTYRAKLSWLSPVTRKCMFVDRSGVQSSVISLESLARKMGSGTARIIEQAQTPFVDRALEAIKSFLGLSQGQQQAS